MRTTIVKTANSKSLKPRLLQPTGKYTFWLKIMTECAACQLESLWLRVRPPVGPPFTLAAVYRPPRRTAAALSADIGALETQYQRVLLQYEGPVFIMGDLIAICLTL